MSAVMDELVWADLSDTDLERVYRGAQAEVSRRAVLGNAVAQIREINQNVANAAGLDPGDEWDPAMQHRGGYQAGATVTRGGVLFESLIDANVQEPGNTADPQHYRWWKNLSDQPAGDEWDPNGHQYNTAKGSNPADEVTYNGSRYRCRQSHKSQPDWSPSAVPALWELLR